MNLPNCAVLIIKYTFTGATFHRRGENFCTLHLQTISGMLPLSEKQPGTTECTCTEGCPQKVVPTARDYAIHHGEHNGEGPKDE